MIAKELEESINTVRAEANLRGFGKMTVEHLALVLITKNAAVREILLSANADVPMLEEKLRQFLTTIPAIRKYGEDARPTSGFNRVIRRALSANADRESITGAHVMAAIYSEPDSYAAYYMQKCGMERLTILAKLAQQPAAPAGGVTPAAGRGVKANDDLVKLAAEGKLEEPVLRERETRLAMHALLCKYKNNVMLVGDPGVGKTAIAHALAHQVARGQAPDALRDLRIYRVAVSELVAGTKYRGDFEERIHKMAQKYGAHKNTVIFIDEIHTLIGAGATASGSSLDGANILKPLLEQPNLRYIGATTQAEYRRHIEKDRALARRFRKVVISEPAGDVLGEIMRRAVSRLQDFHGAAYDEGAAGAAVDYSNRYLPAACLPDKAITLLDEAGAGVRLAGDDKPIGKDDIERIARQAAGLPPEPAQTQKARLARLEESLSAQVIDQPEAARYLSRAVLCSRLGYQETNTVAGAFLLYGPTGVGKTEMARQLAQQLEMPLLRYDMSEYMERHSVARLIGAPPGYVGFEQGGLLVEGVTQRPASVILLDEVEKAHPDVLNVLLQILDYGALTDGNGRVCDFSGALIIMTSNIGSVEISRPQPGFSRGAGGDNGAGGNADDAGADAVRRFFTPELRNRLDAVIRFQALSPAAVSKIVDAQISALAARLAAEKMIFIDIAPRLRQWLKQNGHTPDMGARPLRRLIREHIAQPLALAEATGAVTGGGNYRVDMDGVITERAAPRGKGGKGAGNAKSAKKKTARVKDALPA